MTCSPERTHFCKIIPEDTLRFNKLRFPRKFVRKYGSELSSHVQLTVPDGDTFTVEVAKSDNGEVWLEKGWQQFSEHYSLKPGFFLVFEYEGNCSFQVLPFYISAAETEKPYISDSDDGSDEESLQLKKEEEEEPKAKENDSDDLLNWTLQFLQPKKEAEEVKDNSIAGILNQTPPEGKTSKKSGPCKIQRKTPSDKSNCKTSSDKSLQSIKEEAAQPKENGSADILDRSTPQFLQPKKEAEEAKDNSSSGMLNQTPAEGKTRKESRPCKKLRKTTSDKNEIDCKDASSDEGYPHSKVVRGRLKFGGKQNSVPLQRAAAFKSDKPYFVVEIQPSYIDPGRKMVESTLQQIVAVEVCQEKEAGSLSNFVQSDH
ncbi:hypothetical protein COLO4_11357 [Corchorus olitorius]|uniref:TF-B3 domain-containing protein n=1 Tax=Corchorus olitorius TaxID=93759 RepID=A0A1R3K4T3_9ROSI|nr:hypothetical protein COLO4_11357 [Corchorus olitorius]